MTELIGKPWGSLNALRLPLFPLLLFPLDATDKHHVWTDVELRGARPRARRHKEDNNRVPLRYSRYSWRRQP